MIDDALASLREIFSPPFRAVLLKSLGLTLAAARHVVAGIGAPRDLGDDRRRALVRRRALAQDRRSRLRRGSGFFVGLIFLIAPVSMLVAGFFLDELADHVEAEHLSAGRRGQAAPALASMVLALKFSAVALLINLLAFALWLLPGVNALIFVVANAYLFGREYFQLAALRFLPLEAARDLAPPPIA